MLNTTTPSLPNLFRQLGLPSDKAEIDAFVQSHQLPANMRLCDAPFWNAAQRQLLVEQMQADAPWSLAVDALNRALQKDASEKAQTAETPVDTALAATK